MGELWSDKARWAGLPVLFTRYSMTDETIYVYRGLLFTTEDRLLLYRVLDIRVGRTLFNRILGTGTVVLYAADATEPALVMKGIKNPHEVADLVQRLAEDARARVGIRGTETFGAFAGEMAPRG